MYPLTIHWMYIFLFPHSILQVKALFSLVKLDPADPTDSYLDAWDLRRLYTYAWRRQNDAAKRKQIPRDPGYPIPWWFYSNVPRYIYISFSKFQYMDAVSVPSFYEFKAGEFPNASGQDPKIKELFNKIAKYRALFKDLWREESQPSLANDDESYDVAPPSGSPAARPGDVGTTEHHPEGPSDSGSGALDAQMAEMGFGEEEISMMTDEQKQEVVALLSSIEKQEMNSKWASEFQFQL